VAVVGPPARKTSLIHLLNGFMMLTKRDPDRWVDIHQWTVSRLRSRIGSSCRIPFSSGDMRRTSAWETTAGWRVGEACRPARQCRCLRPETAERHTGQSREGASRCLRERCSCLRLQGPCTSTPDPCPGRGHVARGPGNGTVDPGGIGPTAQGKNGPCHRPSSLDHSTCRQNRCPPQGRVREVGRHDE